MLDSVNFVCFVLSKCKHHCNALRKSIKARMSWHTIQQNEHSPELVHFICQWNFRQPSPLDLKPNAEQIGTRMHSSRMRTARSLSVSHSIRWGGWVLPSPLDTDPQMQTPPPGCRPRLDADTSPWMQTPWIQTPSPLWTE